MTDQTPQDRFIEALGLIHQAEGSPRISGQILGLLILADEPMTLDRIATDLGVSKASVSTNTRLLESRGVAIKVTRKGSRQDYWQASPLPQRRVLPVMAERFRRHAETVTDIAHSFPDDQPDLRARVAGMAAFYQDSAAFLEDWFDRLDGAEQTGAAAAQDTTR